MLSKIKLIQEKLNVANKIESNLFNYRGQFTPQFVEYILESFAQPDDIIVDPFCGSGTVLLKSIEMDLNCFGYEINPTPYIMSSFFSFANLNKDKRLTYFKSLEKKILSILNNNKNYSFPIQSKYIENNKENLQNFIIKLIPHLNYFEEKILAFNTLFYADGKKKKDLSTAILISLDDIKKSLISLPFSKKIIKAELGDARLLHKNCPKKANIIFTSPPYINVFNYHQYYRYIIHPTNWKVLEGARSEIGSNRKHRGNRFKTVIQYSIDMELVLESFWKSLKENGLIIIVVGRESSVRRVPFYNGNIIREIMEGIGGFKDIIGFKRKFVNKFGKDIYEDIIISRKDSVQPSKKVAKLIALNHLKKAGSLNNEIQNDIKNAIDNFEIIKPSIYFKQKGEFFDKKNSS